MKLSEQLVLAFLCAVQTFSLNCEIVQLCDVEGSGVEDCSINEFCCKQSECDKAYNNGSGIDNVIDIEYDYDADYDQKCCNESEEEKETGFLNCKICKRCCGEPERTEIPPPIHCSKCQMCGYHGMFSTGIK